MTLKKILIVSGTHGNEINPIWAVNQFCKQKILIDNNIEYKFIIGNPLAFEKGVRYLNTDLNRSFDFKKNIFNIKRIMSLIEQIF